MLPLLPSVTVTPLVVTVLLPLPTFLLVKANVPPLSVSPVYRVPPVTVAEPAAVRPPSYILVTLLVLSVNGADVMLAVCVPPVKV